MAVAGHMFSPTNLGHADGGGVDVIPVVAHKRIVAPGNVTIIKEHVLSFALVVAAVHHLHRRLGCVWIGAFPAVDTVVAISRNCVVWGRMGGVTIVHFTIEFI